MSDAAKRLAAGYVPNFDLDAVAGRQGELSVVDVVDALKRGASVEVKTDEKFAETGNVYFEYECRGEPSGLRICHTELWVHVLGVDGVHLVLDRLALDLAARRLRRDGYVNECRRGSHPTKGVCVPLATFNTYYRDAKRELAASTKESAA